MDFKLPGEDDPRRRPIREWCEANPEPTGMELARSGYMAPFWPEPYGLAADPELQYLIEDELARANIRRPIQAMIAVHNCGLMLLHRGSDEYREKHLWKALAGEEMWCQGYSEPDAGSDLGGARTRAELDGDVYIVNGSKIWTSGAHFAEFAFTVVRTNPSAPKHKGLSMLMIDLHAPGVEVQPIYNMTGGFPEFCQVFFNDVQVPVAARVGDEGEGWLLAVNQLAGERVLLAAPADVGPSARNLADALIKRGSLDRDAALRQRVAAHYIEGEALRLLRYRDLTDRLHGRKKGPEGSVMKLLGGPHHQRTAAIAMETMGLAGLVHNSEPFAEERPAERWGERMWIAPAQTLMVGTTEIQKSIIAERLLNMPSEPDPDALLPWNEVKRTKAET